MAGNIAVIIIKPMTLSRGHRLGPYRITAPAGAGGMGEVYKAEDTRLDRTVAIKILPSGMTITEDRRLRFEREAKAIARLSNPNICTLYDIGRENDTEYLVMEYLEGRTLAERLKNGPLDVMEALEIGIDVAGALESAHRQGIIHRDLKPENIMLTRDGPKILDFGISKMVTGDRSADGNTGRTKTAQLTDEGKIMGTIPYMSPEQLEGGEVSPLTDIFAFGATMYEMLTGRRAFTGQRQTSLIASILKENPSPISEVRPRLPAALDRAIRKCLEKNPDARWQTARDLADELRWILESQEHPDPEAARVSEKGRRPIWSLVTGAAAVIASLLIAVFLLRDNAPQDSRVRRLVVPVAEAGSAHWPRLSPDGRYLAYRAKDSSGKTLQIWIRPLNSLKAYPLPRTEGAWRPFWSPDSRSVAFFKHGVLKRMAISGGPAQTICKSSRGADGCWGSDDIILFDRIRVHSIMKVPASGGRPTPAASDSSEDGNLGWPWFFPDGRHFLYVVYDSLASPTDNMLLKLGSLDSDLERELIRVDSRVEYAEPGYLLYVKDNILVAHPFDADKLSFTGDPVAIDRGISVWDWGANFSAAEDGTLAYQRGSIRETWSQLLWIDRAGKILDTLGEPDLYRDVALSPDGNRLAFSKKNEARGTRNIWVFDIDRQIPSRVTYGKAQDVYLGWSKDGRYVIFSSNRNDRYQIFRKRADGLGRAELVYSNPDTFDVTGFGGWANNDNLMFIFKGAEPWAYGTLDPDDSRDSAHFVESAFDQYTFGASPDGRYVVYTSNETGTWQIYVRRVDSSLGKWQISADGGQDAVWSRDGSEIFYMENDGKTIVAAPVDLQDGFRAGRPKRLFTVDIQNVGLKRLRFAPAADGQRFLVNVVVQNTPESDFVIVLNWLKGYGEHSESP